MARPEQLKNLIDEDALQRARDKRRKVDHGVTEKVSITKKMYGALDACIKSIGKRGAVVRNVDCLVCGPCRSFVSVVCGFAERVLPRCFPLP